MPGSSDAGLAVIKTALWLAALAWTGLTLLHAIALRPDPQATRLERLSQAWPLTGIVPLGLLSFIIIGRWP